MIKKIFSIEGNIGSGKSSLLKLIENKLQDQVIIVQEPVIQWQAINNDKSLNLLDAFYKDPKRWAYTFQMHAFYSRIKQIQSLQEQIEQMDNQKCNKVIIQERSVYSDRNIFAYNGKLMGFMNQLEWTLYNDAFNFLVENKNNNKLSMSGYIYLQTDPKVSLERIQKRARQEEKSSIDEEYIKNIHQRHEEWLINNQEQGFLDNNIVNNKQVLLIDGNKEFVDCEKRNNEILQLILEFIQQN